MQRISVLIAINNMKRIAHVCILLSAAVLAVCSSLTTARQTGELSLNFEREPILLPRDSAHQVYTGLFQRQSVLTFYERNGYLPVWLAGDEFSAKADTFVTILRTSRRYGLLPQHYHIPELLILYKHRQDTVAQRRLDVLLTDAFFQFVSDVEVGRTATTLDENRMFAALRLLNDQNVRRVIEEHEPAQRPYSDLKTALHTLLDTVSQTERIALMEGSTSDTLAANKIIQYIAVNMERWRHDTINFGNPYIWINIPAFELRVMDGNHAVLESRIIVGKRETPTPVLSSHIDCFTIYPFWNVPRTITVNEFLPEIQKDSLFLSRNRFDVLDKKGNMVEPSTINWQQYTKRNFPFMLRQREGTDNSLGIIKFSFDNPYAVYLHDTNARKLFNNSVRAYSHGCIRMEKSVELARYLFERSGEEHSHTIDRYIQLEKKRTFNVVPAVPIHVRYYTCEVVAGELKLYQDLYGLDKSLLKKLYKPAESFHSF
jgi:murein L,D-transpeptidase YcbB/YkuD